jgi:hypothetical protein
MTYRRRRIVTVVITLAIGVTVLAVATPKIVHAANSCGTSSPLLGRTDLTFKADGVSGGGIISIALWGVLNPISPSVDCVYSRTEIQMSHGINPALGTDVDQNIWAKNPGGAWAYQYTYSSLVLGGLGTSGNYNGYPTAIYFDQYLVNGSPPLRCWLNEDGYTGGHGLDSYTYGSDGNPYVVTAPIPLTNASTTSC